MVGTPGVSTFLIFPPSLHGLTIFLQGDPSHLHRQLALSEEVTCSVPYPLELEEMLDKYYAAKGWSNDGIPTKAKLIQLDLFEEADEIREEH